MATATPNICCRAVNDSRHIHRAAAFGNVCQPYSGARHTAQAATREPVAITV